MKLYAALMISALSLSPAALAQQADTVVPQPSAQAGETSDRTPEQATPTPQNQQDTAGDKTSDRSPDKNVKVEHEPGAAGTAGSSSEGAAAGASGSSVPADSRSK
jgi:hypothetical protein